MAIDILFRDLSVWRQTIYSNPEGPTAPALLMPDPGTISQGAMTCLRDTLQEAADIALAKAMRINPNIERLFLAATPGAPRQDNIERKISLTLVFGLSNTRLMTSSFSDSRSIKQMAQQIFERGMGRRRQISCTCLQPGSVGTKSRNRGFHGNPHCGSKAFDIPAGIVEQSSHRSGRDSIRSNPEPSIRTTFSKRIAALPLTLKV